MELIDKALRAVGLERRSRVADLGHPRDPVLAAWLGMGAKTSAGVNITPANSRECPEVDACVGLIEDTIATLPLDLFERVNDDERKRAANHPLHELLHDSPNSWQTSCEFRTMMEGWRSTYGNAYARVVPGTNGFSQALEPIHPDDGETFRLETGGVALRWRPDGKGTLRTLMPDEFLHLKDKPYSRDLTRGQSRVERHREVIGRAQATGEYLSRFFSSGAVPKTFLEIPEGQKLTDQQMDEMRAQFERKHNGLENLRRIGILNAGLKINQIGADNKDAQVIESYHQAVEQIARAWGIALHMIGVSQDATSDYGTGIEQKSIGFVVYTMRPKFVMWEQALNRTLMSPDTRRRFYFEFNVDGLLRGDFKTRMDAYAVLIQWGLMSVNEVRRLMNLPPVGGGDERLHPMNYAPATRIMEVLLGGGRQSNADKATRDLALALQLVRSGAFDNGNLNGGHA